jgi:hypothetical protein
MDADKAAINEESRNTGKRGLKRGGFPVFLLSLFLLIRVYPRASAVPFL